MRTVLVVEDEAIIALDLACSIEQLGYRVLGPASNGADAQRIARTERPDLLLMDVSIQGSTDGIDTARLITDEFPAYVVFLTAHSDEATRRRAENVRPKAFLAKPCTARQMQSVLAAAFA
ncbi:response regulator [Flaviflagellibacter deserti]|uniref:Response regulator n=1 Tax=Flaviflagellibacter deserti TaxID=2267266 RepID=A0ABV9Z0D8_9HYPH